MLTSTMHSDSSSAPFQRSSGCVAACRLVKVYSRRPSSPMRKDCVRSSEGELRGGQPEPPQTLRVKCVTISPGGGVGGRGTGMSRDMLSMDAVSRVRESKRARAAERAERRASFFIVSRAFGGCGRCYSVQYSSLHKARRQVRRAMLRSYTSAVPKARSVLCPFSFCHIGSEVTQSATPSG